VSRLPERAEHEGKKARRDAERGENAAVSDADDRTATVAGILPYDLAGWPGFLVAPETDDESCARRGLST
jgi:hypothetical protein